MDTDFGWFTPFHSISLPSLLVVLGNSYPFRTTIIEKFCSKIFFRYHNLDDEPTCPIFEFDLESIPLERNILKEHITKEILVFHTKRNKPKPVFTDFRKPAPDVKVISEFGDTKTVVGLYLMSVFFLRYICHVIDFVKSCRC